MGQLGLGVCFGASWLEPRWYFRPPVTEFDTFCVLLTCQIMTIFISP